MTVPLRGFFAAFLLRAGILAAALAITAGIVGMHIMTGPLHAGAAQSMPAAASPVELQTLPAGHSHAPGMSMEDAVAAQPVPGSSSSCAAAGSCPEMSAGVDACVLLPGNASLTAPAPGTAPYALPGVGAAAAASINYSHSPGSPSPGDLCISRT